MNEIDKWETLKSWIIKRHDYLEVEYKATNFSADATELGVFRKIYQAMKDIEERALAEKLRAQAQAKEGR